MIAQCQYHLGLLKQAGANYQEFLLQPSSEEFGQYRPPAHRGHQPSARRPGHQHRA